MAIVTVTLKYEPDPWFRAIAGLSFSTTQLNAAGESVALICEAPKTGTIRKIHASINNVASAGDCLGEIQTVGTDGNNSTTLVHASASVSLALSTTGTKTWDFGSGNGAPVTQGDPIAVVLENVTGDYSLLRCEDVATDANFPYAVTALPSFARAPIPHIWIEYSDGNIYRIPNSPSGPGTTTGLVADLWDNADNPRRRGLRFHFQRSCRVCGVWFFANAEAATTIKAELFDDDGATVLTSTTWDTDHQRTNGTSAHQLNWRLFPTSVTLDAATDYRVTFEPQSGSLRMALHSLDYAAALHLDGNFGQQFHYTTSNANPPTGEGDWSNTLTRQPFMGLIIDGEDDGSGGGGVTRNSIIGG